MKVKASAFLFISAFSSLSVVGCSSNTVSNTPKMSFKDRVDTLIRSSSATQTELSRRQALLNRLYPNNKAEEASKTICTRLNAGATNTELSNESAKETLSLATQGKISKAEIGDVILITSIIQSIAETDCQEPVIRKP